MTHSEEKPSRPRSRFRRLRLVIVALACALLLPALAWFIFERYLQIEAYRPVLEKKIADATGLPVSIGRLDLTLNPLPVIQADTIRVGQDDFRLTAEQALIEPDLQALLHRDVRLTAIDLFKLNAVMPADPADLRSRIREITARMSRPKGEKVKIVLDRIRAQQATLFLGSAQKPVFTGDLDLLDVLSPTPSGRIDAAVIAMRDEVRGGGEFSLRKGPGGKGIDAFKGSFSVDGLQLAKVVKNQKAPRVTLEVDGAFAGTDTRNLTVNLSGDVEPAVNAQQLGESLEGPFLAKAIWDGTTVRLEDVRWKAAGLELAGDVARTEDGAYRLSIPAGTVGAYTLNPLFAMMPSNTFRLEAGQEASVGVEDLAVSVPRDKKFRLERGRITLVGIDLINAKQKDIARNVKGALVLENGTIRVEGLEGAGLELSGTVVPDFDAKVAKVDLQGAFALSQESLQPVLNVKSIRDIGGSITLERIAGTFGSGKGLPKDFVLEGSTEKARVALNTPGFVDVFDPISAKFTTEGKTVTLKGQAQSERMGALDIDGRYTVESRAWEGTLAADVPKVTGAFLKNESTRQRLTDVLKAYGQSTFDMTASLPSEKDKDIKLALTRKDEPALRAQFGFPARKGGGYALGAMVLNGTLPVSAMAGQLPNGVAAEGNATVAFVRTVPEETFRVDVDLANATVSQGEYLRKREGVPATVMVTGKAATTGWAAEVLTASVAGETISGAWRENRLVFPDFNVDASALSTLLANNAQATGTIRGTLATGPVQADLVLQDVAFHYRPEVSIDAINGRVAYADGRLGLDNLVLRGANSTATLALVREQNVWSGLITAEQLDINRILELQRAARGESKEASPEQKEPKQNGGFNGRIVLKADRFIYRRAELTGVNAQITGEGNRIVISDASLRPAEGLAAINATATRDGANAVWVVEGNASLKDASASLLDDLLFKEPRGFTGTVNGDLTFRVPMQPNTSPINTASATAVLEARNGSFGKMGVATKVLNVLRTTEVLRLRLPSLSDQGLTYDTTQIEIDMTDGVMRVKRADIKRPSFAMNAKGTVDFPKDDMRLDIQVYPFESVTGLAEKVPIVGGIVGGLKGLTPIGLVASGSPYDPSVTPGNILRADRAPEKPQETDTEPPAEDVAKANPDR